MTIQQLVNTKWINNHSITSQQPIHRWPTRQTINLQNNWQRLHWENVDVRKRKTSPLATQSYKQFYILYIVLYIIYIIYCIILYFIYYIILYYIIFYILQRTKTSIFVFSHSYTNPSINCFHFLFHSFGHWLFSLAQIQFYIAIVETVVEVLGAYI